MIFKQIITLTQEKSDSKQDFLNQIESLENKGCKYFDGYTINKDEQLSEVILYRIIEIKPKEIINLN